MSRDDENEPVSGDAPTQLAPATPQSPPTLRDDHTEQHATFAIDEKIAGRYVVKAVLGAGGMGTVYRAIDEELDEIVALKVLKRGAADSAYLRDEVRLAQKVTHPGVCRTFDLETAGPDNELQFIKMEYVPGEPLSDRIERDKRLPIADAVRIARGIADGLAAMHAQEIVHRDLKPANVMLARTGRIVLMDFGLAHKLATGDAAIAGTPGYMAPEQLLGEDLDRRTDYYALGCVLYEMLVGERVYGKGTMLEIADRHIEAPVPDARQRRPETPRWLARVTTGLLSKQRADREVGMAQLAPKPKRVMLPLAAAVLAGAIAVVAVWIVRGRQPWRPEITDLPQFEESSDGASLSPDGKWIAFNSDRLDSEHRFRLYLVHPDGSEEHAITPVGKSYDEPRWTRDGKYLLSAEGWDTLQKIPLDGGAPIDVMDGETMLQGNSPDDCGGAIVFVRSSFDGFRLMLKEGDAPPRELVRAYADEWLEKPRCDRSGQRIVFVRGMTPASAFGSDVFVVDRQGKLTQLTTDHRAGAAGWSPDGTVIWSSRVDGKVQLFELAIGGSPIQRTFDDGPDDVPDVGADGDTVLFGREVNLYSIYGGERGKDGKLGLSSRRETAYNLRVAAPHGELVLAERASGAGDEILVFDIAHGTDRVLGPGYFPFPSFDGAMVYFRAVADPGTLMVIPLAGGTAREVGRFPGRIVVGTDGLDGPHVEIDRDHALESWRITDGQPQPEGVAGLLVPAPRGRWRYVQVPGEHFELRVIAPGTALDSRACVRPSEALINPWLDDHRVAYVDVESRDDRWHILDVTTCTDTDDFTVPARGGVNAVLAPDGKHWFEAESVSRVTRHVARGFADRPR